MRLRAARIVTPGGVIAGEVVIEDGRIQSVLPAAHDADAVDLGDDWLVPGFIDTHVHGGGGAQCNTTDPDEIRAVARFHGAHGTTALLATLVPAPEAELIGALGAAVEAAGPQADGATILGSHLEGPFLSPCRPGALDPEAFAQPDPARLRRLLAAGLVAMMTVAPELPGALELIRELTDRSVVVSLGHSDATDAEAIAGIDAGATSATHLFNAMRPFHHRQPGIAGAVLGDPRVSAELICDGVHVAPAALGLALRAARGGVRLVTDAVAAAGMPDGRYDLGGRPVTVTNGRATVAGGARLAGSTLTMDRAVANAVGLLGLDLPAAVALASAVPAQLLGLGGCKGAITPGRDADLVVLGDDLAARGTMVAGAWISEP